MKAFHNDTEVKKKYLSRVEHHIKVDNLIRGKGWDGSKGCAVGCTLEKYDHKAYETELGIPEWLARVEDALFEGMNLEKSKTFPKEFLESINPGSDLDKIKAPFLIMVLRRSLEHFDHEKYPDIYQAVQSVIDLYEIGEAPPNQFQAAEAAAEAAWAAEAAEAARAESVWAAGAAAEAAAGAAARAAAEAAAGAAARAAEYDYFADELLKLLEGEL